MFVNADGGGRKHQIVTWIVPLRRSQMTRLNVACGQKHLSFSEALAVYAGLLFTSINEFNV